jgi:proteic killer suppression protein
MAIQSFSEANTEAFFKTGVIKKGIGWSNIKSVAKRKLDMLDYSVKLEDLKSPPGNRLEALTADLTGYHSIRVNDQWRIVFKWTATGPKEVRVTDYH